MADLKIQQAFLDGINTVFFIMFTDKLAFSLMDTAITTTNIYGESVNKTYKTAVNLVGKIVIYTSTEKESVEENTETAVITIPTKQLILNNIPHTSEDDHRNLERALFAYEGKTYTIDKVTPKTLVADKWQMYEFNCTVSKRNALKV